MPDTLISQIQPKAKRSIRSVRTLLAGDLWAHAPQRIAYERYKKMSRLPSGVQLHVPAVVRRDRVEPMEVVLLPRKQVRALGYKHDRDNGPRKSHV